MASGNAHTCSRSQYTFRSLTRMHHGQPHHSPNQASVLRAKLNLTLDVELRLESIAEDDGVAHGGLGMSRTSTEYCVSDGSLIEI